MIVLLQGGYLEGKLRLPKGGEDGLRVVISTRPDRCTMHFFFIYLSKVFVNCSKGFRLALPVLLCNCERSKSCKKSFSNVESKIIYILNGQQSNIKGAYFAGPPLILQY